MDTISVDLLSNEPNSVVVKLPGRRFPSVVIQGDSLKMLLDLARDIKGLIAKRDLQEATDTLEELEMVLSGYCQIYEATLAKNDIPLPY